VVGGKVVMPDDTTVAGIEDTGLRAETDDPVGVMVVMEFGVKVGAVPVGPAVAVAVAGMGVEAGSAVVIEFEVTAAVGVEVQLMVARPWVILCEAPGLVKSLELDPSELEA
jgi:hypothetical protein